MQINEELVRQITNAVLSPDVSYRQLLRFRRRPSRHLHPWFLPWQEETGSTKKRQITPVIPGHRKGQTPRKS